MFCGSFLRMLFRNVMPHDAAANGPGNGVVARIMSGYAADDSAFQAAGGLCGPGCRQS